MKTIEKRAMVINVEPEDIKNYRGCANWNFRQSQLCITAVRTGEIYSVCAQIIGKDRMVSSRPITITGLSDDEIVPKIKMLLISGVFPWDGLIKAYSENCKDYRINFTH